MTVQNTLSALAVQIADSALFKSGQSMLLKGQEFFLRPPRVFDTAQASVAQCELWKPPLLSSILTSSVMKQIMSGDSWFDRKGIWYNRRIELHRANTRSQPGTARLMKYDKRQDGSDLSESDFCFIFFWGGVSRHQRIYIFFHCSHTVNKCTSVRLYYGAITQTQRGKKIMKIQFAI